jgi:hypothetical protein
MPIWSCDSTPASRPAILHRLTPRSLLYPRRSPAQELAAAEHELAAASARLEERLEEAPISPLNLATTQLQRQLTATAALDGAIRAVGTVQAALAQRAQCEGAAIAARFLTDGGAGVGAAGATAPPPGAPASIGGASEAGSIAAASASPAATPRGAAAAYKVLKMGDCAMKRLRNGDVYKVHGASWGRRGAWPPASPRLWSQGRPLHAARQRPDLTVRPAETLTCMPSPETSPCPAPLPTPSPQGKYSCGRKNGEGCYCFTNADVYEGEFRDDRMAGAGVYSFHPEGR